MAHTEKEATEMQCCGPSPEFYTGNDNGSFRSWRRGDVNLIVTPDPHFYDLFITATQLAKRFNLMGKNDRIALFQAVLYGVSRSNLVNSSDDDFSLDLIAN